MTTNLIMRDWMHITRTCSSYRMTEFRTRLMLNISMKQFDYLMTIVGH
jgi:hypothetical protein